MRIVYGDILEGGGQILRFTLPIAAITGTPIRIARIRAKRPNPGLRRQHMISVESVAILSNAKVEGLKLGSQELTFIPSSLRGGRYSFDIGTAGSVTLVLQALLPVMAFTPDHVEVTVVGGTNNPMAPPIDYLERILVPVLRSVGFNPHIELIRRGFYPIGGGIVKTTSTPIDGSLKPIRIVEFGYVKRIAGIAYSSRLPPHIVDRMVSTVEKLLSRKGYDVVLEREVLQPSNPRCAVSPGCGILLYAELSSGARVASDSLGVRGKPAEEVAEEAVRDLESQIETAYPVDRHLADQLIIWMALADGESSIATTELTLHTITCIELAKRLLDVEFEVDGGEGKPSKITCKGIGLKVKKDSL